MGGKWPGFKGGIIMKRLLSVFLALCLLVGIAQIPVSAVSSGGLKTYTLSGSKYVEKKGLKYDYELNAVGIRHPKKNNWNYDAADSTFPQNTGVIKFATRIIAAWGRESDCAFGTEPPIIRCWIDGDLFDDGAKPKASYAKIEKKLGEPFFAGVPGSSIQKRHDFIDAEWEYTSKENYSYSVTQPYSLDTRTMDLGKHTIKFVINPDFASEEENAQNNEAIRTFYIKEAVSTAPSIPTLENVTDSSITVHTTAGQEYSIDGGTTWQSRGLFEGLEPETSYEVITRTAETDTAMASAVSAPLTVTTKPLAPDAPAAPVLGSVTSSSITVSAVAGLEYNLNGGVWQDSGTFSGLSPNTRYEIRARVKATGDMPCSEASPALAVTTDKQAVAAPVAPIVVSRTDTTVTVQTFDGQEYSIDGGSTWQSSGVFTGLSSNREYSITARIAETETAYASPSSPALSVKTKKSAPSAPAAPKLWRRTDTTITIY